MTKEEAKEFIAQSIKSDVDMALVADAIKALEQEPRKGHWIEKGKTDIAYDMCGYKSWATKYMCNHCGFIHTAIENHGVYSYCPNCGAKMESEDME